MEIKRHTATGSDLCLTGDLVGFNIPCNEITASSVCTARKEISLKAIIRKF